LCQAADGTEHLSHGCSNKLSCAAAVILLPAQVRAMVFEPRDSSTCIMLDGEVVPAAPIYLEVHQGLIRVLINPAHRVEPAADHSRHQLV
jgi:hypothetical protein